MSCWSVLLLLVTTLFVAESYALQVDVSEVQNYTKLASWKYSTLYRIQANAGYENNPLLIHLVGSRYGTDACNYFRFCTEWLGKWMELINPPYSDIGYGYGFLLTKEIEDNYHSLLYSLLGDKWYDKVG